MDTYDPCLDTPCGKNAICTNNNGIAKCTCVPSYIGNPYVEDCRSECMSNQDCPDHLACFNQHCSDPCPGVCGSNAHCEVSDHIPVCSCLPGYSGDPFRSCKIDKFRKYIKYMYRYNLNL